MNAYCLIGFRRQELDIKFTTGETADGRIITSIRQEIVILFVGCVKYTALVLCCGSVNFPNLLSLGIVLYTLGAFLLGRCCHLRGAIILWLRKQTTPLAFPSRTFQLHGILRGHVGSEHLILFTPYLRCIYRSHWRFLLSSL